MVRAVPAAALALVKRSEGFSPKRKPDVAKQQIGYGHDIAPGDPLWNAHISELAAEELAEQDLDRAANELWAVFGAAIIGRLTDNQWSALLDFVFNEGIGHFQTSTLAHFVSIGQFDAVGDQFGRWIYAGRPPVVDHGLVTRRAAEKALWQS